MSLAANDPRHGTYNGYSNLRCRCKACCAANTEQHRDWLHRSGRHRPRAVYLAERRERAANNHGLSGYRRGCRCAVCREAMRVYKADYRARQRAAA